MIMTWEAAVTYLLEKGMKPAYESTFSDQNRMYFAYSKNNVFLDHSATVTEIGKNKFYVADFSYLKEE